MSSEFSSQEARNHSPNIRELAPNPSVLSEWQTRTSGSWDSAVTTVPCPRPQPAVASAGRVIEMLPGKFA